MNLKSTALRLALALGLVLAFSATRASAATYTAPCPQLGQADGCNIVITISNGVSGPVASVSASNGNYDGCDDQLVGVINNSSSSITGLLLNGSGIGSFDSDGAWSTSCITSGPNTYGCGTPTQSGNAQQYAGPITTFPTFSANSVTVHFDSALGMGGTSYFALEEPISGGITVGAINPTPEPGTLVLFGSGLIGLAGVLRRKLVK